MTRAAGSRAALKAAIEETADRAGTVTPNGVVEAARDEASPLHPEFEWDDTVAGHKHRLDQARSLIREITYEVAKGESRVVSLVTYVHHPHRNDQGYVQLSAVVRNRKLSNAVMADEISRIESSIKRALEVADVLGMTPDWEAFSLDLANLKSKLLGRSRKRVAGGERPRPSV